MDETEQKLEGDTSEGRKEQPKFVQATRALLRLASVSERGLGNKGFLLTTRLGESISLPSTAVRASVRASATVMIRHYNHA